HAILARGRRAPDRRRAGAARVPRRPTPPRRRPRCTPRGLRRRPAAPRAAAAADAPLLRRQPDLWQDGFVPHQVPADLRRAIVELETRVESTFNNFRGEIDGRRVDDHAIAEILRTI